MEQKYKTILTHHGERVIVEALANKIPVPLKEMAIGDGNGSSITPSASQTTLVREVYRAEITDLLEDPQNRHQMIAELLIPENVGGFIVREIGLFDEQGGLVAVANCPENYKPVLEQGSGKVQYYRMILQVSSSDAVTLSINNNIVYATRTEFNEFVNNLSSPDGYKHIGRCKSVAELRTIRPTEHGQRILVDAYYEDGTTGGGEFVADLQDLVTPDDGGVCFVVNNNGGRWKRVDLSHLTLFDFGAVGDGVTNDESAFVNAMRYSQFFIENGTFRINNAVNSVRDNVQILGNKTGKLVLGAGIQQ
ncbi:TPA: phage tail protein, partial [Mannheimia haemolytica]|nr:phage tail protein [Mannheimia haemolytica]